MVVLGVWPVSSRGYVHQYQPSLSLRRRHLLYVELTGSVVSTLSLS
jgi:hypothetical protein